MKYTCEDGTVYKTKEDYWIVMYRMKDNEPSTRYMIGI